MRLSLTFQGIDFVKIDETWEILAIQLIAKNPVILVWGDYWIIVQLGRALWLRERQAKINNIKGVLKLYGEKKRQPR